MVNYLFGHHLLGFITKKCSASKKCSIVDIGCGTGFPLLELEQRFGYSCKVFKIGPWERVIDRANRKKEQ